MTQGGEGNGRAGLGDGGSRENAKEPWGGGELAAAVLSPRLRRHVLSVVQDVVQRAERAEHYAEDKEADGKSLTTTV